MFHAIGYNIQIVSKNFSWRKGKNVTQNYLIEKNYFVYFFKYQIFETMFTGIYIKIQC